MILLTIHSTLLRTNAGVRERFVCVSYGTESGSYRGVALYDAASLVWPLGRHNTQNRIFDLSEALALVLSQSTSLSTFTTALSPEYF